MILDKRYPPKWVFLIGRYSPKHIEIDPRHQGQDWFEKSLAFTLFVIMVLALLFPQFNREEAAPEFVSNTSFDVSAIPQTRQRGMKRPKPPEKPAVPIEAEIENIAEDVTIAETNFSFGDFSNVPGPPGPGVGMGGISVGPRLVKEVFPMVSGKLKGKGVKGEIDLRVKVNESGKVADVELVKNTTKSSEIAQAAIDAAYKCIYMPALKDKKPIAVWTNRTIRIDYTE